MIIKEPQYSQYLIFHKEKCYKLNGYGCEESTFARKVPMDRELKHLLLKTPHFFTMAHLQASKKLNFKKVKDILLVKNIELADINQFGVLKGEVNPFLKPFWPILHLVDDSVLTRDWMTTNDGTRTGYIKFKPQLLLQAKNYLVSKIAH